MNRTVFAHTDKTPTKVLKTLTIKGKHFVTIEEVLEGEYEKHFVVKSYSKTLFGKTKSSLAAIDMETDFNGDKITGYAYPVYRMVRQASEWLKHVKNNKYKHWIKYQ